ncbi:hypothetical protein [Thalassiella azotivora]
MDVAAWRAHLDRPLRDHVVVLGVAPLGSLLGYVEALREAGVRDVVLVASRFPGAPEPAAPDSPCRVVHVDVPAPAIVSDAIRAEERALRALPPHVERVLDEVDPRREALWLATSFTEQDAVLGRRVVGGRRPQWGRLEDKTVVDSVWDGAGVARAPSRVVPCDVPAALAALRDLDAGAGVVLSGDTSTGVAGGADLVRRARTDDDVEAAVSELAPRCRSVRVMPFLDGVPCSVHGVVLPDGVAVFRPVELVNLLRRDGQGVLYGGLSTWWDPPPPAREEMREVARRVGHHVASAVGYRGAFGLDGVLTARGWRPTELNARTSVGLLLLTEGLPDLPLTSLQRAVVSGHDPGVTAAELEGLVLSVADGHRGARVRAFTWAVPPPAEPVRVALAEPTVAGVPLEPWDGEPGPAGVLELLGVGAWAAVRWSPGEGGVRRGERVAGRAAAAYELADRLWGTGFGPLDVPGEGACEGVG